MKRRLAFLLVSTHLGGAERSLLEILDAIDSDAELRNPLLILPKSDGPLIAELEKRSLEFLVEPMPERIFSASRKNWMKSLAGVLLAGPQVLAYLRRLSTLLERHDVELLHTTGIKCHFLGAWATRGSQARAVWHLRDIFQPGFTKMLLLLTRHLTNPYILANSDATARSLLNVPEKIRTIYNGIDTDKFKPDPDANLMAELHLRPSIPVVGISGVLARWKGQLEFIEMARKYLDSGRDAQFLIVGDEIYDTFGEAGIRKVIENKISELNLQEKILITGFRNDMVRVYNTLDVLVHASIRPEPFGRVIVEALACGVPVLAARDGGVLEIINDGTDGLLFEPGNTNDMAAALDRVLRDKRFSEQIAKNGRERVVERFSFGVFKKNLLSTLKGIELRN